MLKTKIYRLRKVNATERFQLNKKIMGAVVMRHVISFSSLTKMKIF